MLLQRQGFPARRPCPLACTLTPVTSSMVKVMVKSLQGFPTKVKGSLIVPLDISKIQVDLGMTIPLLSKWMQVEIVDIVAKIPSMLRPRRPVNSSMMKVTVKPLQVFPTKLNCSSIVPLEVSKIHVEMRMTTPLLLE